MNKNNVISTSKTLDSFIGAPTKADIKHQAIKNLMKANNFRNCDVTNVDGKIKIEVINNG